MPYTHKLRIAGVVLCAGFLLSIPVYFALPLLGLAEMESETASVTETTAAAAYGEPVCGNGRIESTEQCDDGNIVIEDGCTGCMVNAGYSCIGAPSLCTAVRGQDCGDGRIGFGEQCDDLNDRDFDGCSRYCAVEEKFRCEGTPSVCKIATAKCGDAVVDIGEPCDDGNTPAGVGSSASCTVEEGFRCGSQPSDCDRLPDLSGLSSAPSVAAASSSSVQSSAAPAPETQAASSAAASSAAAEPAPAPAVSQSQSTSQPYRFSPRMRADLQEQRALEAEEFVENRPLPERSGCGDGILLEEACDDGDKKAGDGCSDACAVEPGYSCHGHPSICEIRCGDGVTGGTETCDDGGTVSGDGCSETCRKE